MGQFDQPLKDSGARTDFGTGSVRDSKNGKGRYDLLPARALHALAQHFEKGAAKYGDRNWEQGQPVSNYLDSGLRHIFQYLRGLRDEPHLVSGAWNFLCAIDTLVRIEEGSLPSSLNDLPLDGEERLTRRILQEMRDEEGSLPGSLNDLPGLTPSYGVDKDGALLYNPLEYYAVPILLTLEKNQIDSDNSPDDTLVRLIAERNKYRDAYQHTFETLTNLTSPMTQGPGLDASDTRAAQAYTRKAKEVYGDDDFVSDDRTKESVARDIAAKFQGEASSCSTSSCGCQRSTENETINTSEGVRYFKIRLAGRPEYRGTPDDDTIYCFDPATGNVSWKDHTHPDGKECEAGSVNQTLSLDAYNTFVVEGTFVLVSPTEANK